MQSWYKLSESISLWNIGNIGISNTQKDCQWWKED